MVPAEGGVSDDATDRGDLDEVTGALRAQDREDGLRDEEGAEQVGLELVAQLGLSDLLHHAEESVASVVDHDVEATELLVGGSDRFAHGVLVGDVEAQSENCVLAVLRHEVVQRGHVARGRGDAVAPLEGGPGELAAQPAGGAGDEPGLGHGKSFRVRVSGHDVARCHTRLVEIGLIQE